MLYAKMEKMNPMDVNRDPSTTVSLYPILGMSCPMIRLFQNALQFIDYRHRAVLSQVKLSSMQNSHTFLFENVLVIKMSTKEKARSEEILCPL